MRSVNCAASRWQSSMDGSANFWLAADIRIVRIQNHGYARSISPVPNAERTSSRGRAKAENCSLDVAVIRIAINSIGTNLWRQSAPSAVPCSQRRKRRLQILFAPTRNAGIKNSMFNVTNTKSRRKEWAIFMQRPL